MKCSFIIMNETNALDYGMDVVFEKCSKIDYDQIKCLLGWRVLSDPANELCNGRINTGNISTAAILGSKRHYSDL